MGGRGGGGNKKLILSLVLGVTRPRNDVLYDLRYCHAGFRPIFKRFAHCTVRRSHIDLMIALPPPFFQVDINDKTVNMVVWKKTALFLLSLCAAATCGSAFQKPLDPFTLLRYDKRIPEDEPLPQPQPLTKEKNVSVEFDEYPVSGRCRRPLFFTFFFFWLRKVCTYRRREPIDAVVFAVCKRQDAKRFPPFE